MESDALFSLEDALHDSPKFRQNLMKEVHKFEGIVKSQEAAIKTIRRVIEEGAHMTELLPRASTALHPLFALPEGGLFNAHQPNNVIDPAIVITADYNVRSGMVRTTGGKILAELLNYRQERIEVVREAKRTYERSLDRYEATMSKHAMSLKRPGEKREAPGSDSSELTATRQNYYQCMANLMEQLSNYHAKNNEFWLDKAKVYFGILREGEALLHQIYQTTNNLPSCNMVGTSGSDVANGGFKGELLSRTEQEFDVSQALNTRIYEKHGYLFRKKPRGIAPLWKLVYVSIEEAMFCVWLNESTGGNGHHSSASHSSANSNIGSASAAAGNSSSEELNTLNSLSYVDSNNVLTCQIKLYESVERACCFEVSTPQRSFVFQALSEGDLMDWLRVFENAKNQALKPQPATSSNNKQINETQPDFVHLEGIPDATRLLSHKYRRQFVLSSELTLFDGDSVGTFSATIHELSHFGMNCRTEDIRWTEIESFKMTQRSFSSSLYLTLRNRVVDATDGRCIEVIFMDSKQHSQIASLFHELCKLLAISGKKKRGSKAAKEKLTELQIVHRLYQSPLSRTDGGFPEEGAPEKYSDAYPEGFTIPSTEEIEDLHSDYIKKEGELEHKEMDMNVPIPACLLFSSLFLDPQGRLLTRLHKQRKNADVELGKVQNSGPTEYIRELSYKVPINNPLIKSKETRCTESMRLSVVREKVCYCVDVKASTPDVPYGDAFMTVSRFVISFSSISSCRLQSFFGMQWNKSVLVKSIIRASAERGFTEYCRELKNILNREYRDSRTSLPSNTDDGNSEEIDGTDDYIPSGDLRDRSRNFVTNNLSMVLLCISAILLIALRGLSVGRPASRRLADRRHYHSKYRPRAKISITDVLEEAVAAEKSMRQAEYVQWLYDVLMRDECRTTTSMANGNSNDCLEAWTEWNKVMQDIAD